MEQHYIFFDQAACDAAMENIDSLLASIGAEGDRRLVEEFWRRAARYFGVLFGIDRALEEGRMQEDTAAGIVIRETDSILLEGQRLEEAVADGDIVAGVKKLFRQCGIPVGLKSEIVKHAFTKPGGYAGDYGIIEMIYNDRVLSKGFGYCADRRFLADDYARAVRSRKNKMKEILGDFLKNPPAAPVEILNIACGSSREIAELFRDRAVETQGPVRFTLVDQDQAALDFSRDALAGSPPGIEFRYLRHSVYDHLKEPDRYRDMLSGQDLVYTIGLADYIPDGPLGELVAFYFSLLKPGGRVVIAHKDSKNFSPLAPDWWCDWTFHLRSEQEMIALVNSCGMEHYALSSLRETETNIIFFLTIQKQ